MLTYTSHRPALDGVQLASRDRCVPAVHVERELVAPDQRHAHGVHEDDQQQFDHDGIAQPQRGGNGGIELRTRLVADQAVVDELPHDRQQAPVNDDLRQDQQGRGDQQAQVRLDVVQERQRHAVAPGVPFDHRQHQQRHPDQHDQREYPSLRQLESVSGQSRAPPELVQRSAGHQREIAQLLQGRPVTGASRRLRSSVDHPEPPAPVVSARHSQGAAVGPRSVRTSTDSPRSSSRSSAARPLKRLSGSLTASPSMPSTML